MVIAKSPKQPDPGHCQKPKTTGHIMLMTESPKQASSQPLLKAQNKAVSSSCCSWPRAQNKQSLWSLPKKPETKQFIILMADIPEQAAHLMG
jgi:hypothetical protein